MSTTATELPPRLIEVEQVIDKADRRTYWIRTKERRHRVPSVTTLLKNLDKPALMRWAFNTGLDGVAELVQNDVGIPSTRDGLLSELTTRDLAYWQVSGKAADRGLRQHDWLEILLRDDILPDPAEFHADERGYVAGMAAWWLAERPEVISTETVVGSEAWGFAGRFDYLRRLNDGGIRVGDLKTATLDKNGVIRPPYRDHHLQSALYQVAVAETFGFDPETVSGETISIAPNGDHRVTPCLISTSTALVMRELDIAIKGLEKEMRAYEKEQDGDG